jgi:hypothetical protein
MAAVMMRTGAKPSPQRNNSFFVQNAYHANCRILGAQCLNRVPVVGTANLFVGLVLAPG